MKRIAISEAVASMKLRERDALRRVFGMQVEREPDDIGVELAPQLLGDGLAEPAEGSDVVAPNKDRMLGHCNIVPEPWRASPSDVEQFRMGLEVELDQGAHDPKTDVTDDDPILTGEIARAHLEELPD